MTNAWTPGPWEIEERSGKTIICGPCSECLLEICEPNRHGHGLTSIYEREANASLIAAAPDMAEALDTIVKSLQGQKSAVAATIITWANSALAKAR